MRRRPQLATDRASSRNMSALALPSERDLLQAPISVTAPRYVTVPRGAVSGSREPSRHPQSRVVSAVRLRSRLPPPRRRVSIRRQLHLLVQAHPRCTELCAALHAEALSPFVGSPMSRARVSRSQCPQLLRNRLSGSGVIVVATSIAALHGLRPLVSSHGPVSGSAAPAVKTERGTLRSKRFGPLRRGPSAF